MTIDARLIEQCMGAACRSITPVAGGDIHTAARVETKDGRVVFAKANSGRHADVLEGEHVSLSELKRLGAHYYPTPIGFERSANSAVLLMTYYDLTPLTSESAPLLAQRLIHQHKMTAPQYGWPQSNHIGTTPQENRWAESWCQFYHDARLIPQLELAITNGLDQTLVDGVRWLCDHLDQFIDDSAITPALVHGDLWGGNVGYDSSNKTALLFDPAPYFGDREVDLAMTRLFGGFPDSFYRAYTQAWPLAPGYETRVGVYNLYHALNHFNLFGSGYTNLVAACLPDKL